MTYASIDVMSRNHGKTTARLPVYMLAVMLAIFGLLAYIAYPKTTVNVLPRRFSSAACSTPTAAQSSAATAVVGAADSKHLGLLDSLLPLTNFSSLTSARILDAAAAKGADNQQQRQLMQLHQDLYCSAKMHLVPLPGSTKVSFGNVSLHVYEGNDIVSGFLAGQEHTWESSEIQQMLWGLRQHTSPQQAAVKAKQQQDSSSNTQQQMPLFVDVGANVGWFALNAAAAGARVAAFEAMPSNIELIRRSLCSSPWLAERTGLYGTGLGPAPSTCHIISGKNNLGDGHTVCGKDIEKVLAETNTKHKDQYVVRGEMSVRRLDALLSEDVQVMKIDVEGFELQVLEGAEGLLTRHNVWYIMAECNRGIIKAEGQIKYLKFLDKMGYYISAYGFEGPFMKPKDIAAGTANLPDFANLYCVKKELLSPGLVQSLTS